MQTNYITLPKNSTKFGKHWKSRWVRIESYLQNRTTKNCVFQEHNSMTHGKLGNVCLNAMLILRISDCIFFWGNQQMNLLINDHQLLVTILLYQIPLTDSKGESSSIAMKFECKSADSDWVSGWSNRFLLRCLYYS